jgi:hypothetical protein
LTVAGHGTIELPWAIVQSWPLFDNVLPERLAMYVSLITALMVALWTAARPPGRLRIALPALAVVALLPNPAAGVWATGYSVPPFFTDGAFTSCLDPGENILPLPINEDSESMLWQTAAGYRFRMTAGAITINPPAAFQTTPEISSIADGQKIPAADASWLEAFIKAYGVTSVVADASLGLPWLDALERIAPGQLMGGVYVFHISDGSPSCLGATG